MHTVKAYMAYFYIIVVNNSMHYSNKCQLFCTCEQSEGGKKGSMVCKLLLKPINNDGFSETGDKIDLHEDNG